MALKPKRKVKIESIRTIVRDDLPRLVQKRNYVDQAPLRIRESHHWVARLIALNLTHVEISRATGYSLGRVAQLSVSPAMRELVATYRKDVHHSWGEMIQDYQAIATANMVRAERQIADRLDEADEAGETLPIRELMAISRDAADRFGFGKKTTNVNVNVDLAARMEKLRGRETKFINGTAVPELKTVGASPSGDSSPAKPNSTPQLEALARPSSPLRRV